MAERAPALYRGLVRMHPSAFRARFGDEMLQLVRDEKRHAGRVPHLRTSRDLLGSLITQGWKDKMMMKNKLAVAAFLVIGVAGGTALVTGAIFEVSSILTALSIFAALGILFAVIAVVGRKTGHGAEHDYAGRKFRWWWVPAALIGAFEGLFAVGQLIDDPKLTNVVALGIIGGFAALVFFGMAVRNRRAGNWMIATGVLPMLPFFWMIVPPILALLVIVMALSENVRMSDRAPAAA
jgi:hypothetical protein